MMDTEKGRNKFEQELYIRENPEAESATEIEDNITKAFKTIVERRIGNPHQYTTSKFIALCEKIGAELQILSQEIRKYLCVSHRVPVDSLPIGAIDVLEAQLISLGYSVSISTAFDLAPELGQDVLFYIIKVWYERKEDENEENNQNRDKELSESQEHSG